MPKVSIGLPVYNGENYLSTSIRSILDQTFDDFELIICDNASSDGTEEICREVAERDPRVIYLRSSENIGAAANYNKTFHKASADLFKWAAHDDQCAPQFVERCVQKLEEDDAAVLVFSQVHTIDEQGELVKLTENSYETGSADPVERFRSFMNQRFITEIFGLIRTRFLSQTKLIAPYPSGDRMLLADLALKGRFLHIDEPLFAHRDHAERSHKKLLTAKERAIWFDPAKGVKRQYPAWRFVREILQIIWSSPVSTRDKCRCTYRLAQWSRWNSDRFLSDLRE